jgi:hypothetical protein
MTRSFSPISPSIHLNEKRAWLYIRLYAPYGIFLSIYDDFNLKSIVHK